MDHHVGHAVRERLGVPFAPSRSGPAKPRGARPESHEVGAPVSGYAGRELRQPQVGDDAIASKPLAGEDDGATKTLRRRYEDDGATVP